MNEERPNPDALLARVQAQEAESKQGKLKIFFGYAAGVGKTYAMLEAARRERADGVDVVVGYVEPHGRPETEVLLEGLEILPNRQIPHRGVALKEFDLEAALARHPQLILVDELAHTNAGGSRHAKRSQDVEELLNSGIDVYTTLNVQHVESLNDVVAQITGITVRETVSDTVLERARDIELIDITPEELIARLKEGKVYVPQQAERALERFFQEGNLAALRELSLRQTAQRLSRDVDAARQQRSVQQTWATRERLLVCVGPSPTSAKLIRTTKRMAAAMDADWLAVAVTSASSAAGAVEAKERIGVHLRMAEQLGAETHILIGDDVSRRLVDFARSRNVTKIVVGKTSQPRWKRLLWGTVVDALLERSGDIDIYVIRGEHESELEPRRTAVRNVPIPWGNYLRTAAVIAVCVVLGWISSLWQFTEANVVMLFLLGIVFVATRYGRGPAIAAAIASVLFFDFCFVPPYLTFTVHDAQYVLTFAVMLIIGVLISTLTARTRDQLSATQKLERHTAALFRLTRQLTEVAGTEFLIRIAGQQLREIFDGEVVIYLRSANGPIDLRFGEQSSIVGREINPVVAQWVSDHDQVAGAGTDTLPNATAFFVPLVGTQRTVGAVGVRPNDPARFSNPEQRRLLETCASLIALSLERDYSVLEAHEAQIRIQSEQLRNALLSSVSHDLRTPLAAIAGASSSLLEAHAQQDESTRRELLQSLVEESGRLSRLVDNLLDMMRLESGDVALNRQWHVLEEIVGSALARLRRELAQHHICVAIPADFPLLNLDGVLFEQVLVNLLENAARYTPAGTRIDVSARTADGRVEIRVADTGPGLPPGSEQRVFEKFFRGASVAADGRRGVGLGLAICRSIVEAHGGRITARNALAGGAEFLIVLPSDRRPPRVILDEVSATAGT